MASFDFNSPRLHKEIALNLLKAQILFAIVAIDQIDHLNAERVIWEQCVWQVERDFVLNIGAIVVGLKIIEVNMEIFNA